MIKTFIAVTVTLCATFSVHAQEIGISIGYGQYKMTDLKMVNEESVKQGNPVPLKITDDFPGYITIGIGANFLLSKTFILGGEISLNSTGSRTSYTDYSGRLDLDQKLHGISIAANPAFALEKTDRNLLTFDTKIGVIFTSHQLMSKLRLGDSEEKESIKFKSLNAFIEPGFRYRRSLGSLFFISVRAGYNINVVKGKLYLKEDDNAYLMVNSDPAKADWSGIRVNMALSFRLNGIPN